MGWISRWRRRRRYEEDLAKELEFHLEAETRDGMRAGLSPEQALRRARLELGGVEQVKEEMRDARPTAWLEQWWQDTRFAFRTMARAPGFTAAAVLTLGVGIGANTAVWSVLNGLLLRSLPVENPDQLHVLRRRPPDEPDGHLRFSFPALQRLQQAAPPGVRLAAMTAVVPMYATIGEGPEAIQGQLVSGDWFQLLGIGAALGRPLGPADHQTVGGHPVVVLSHGFWTRRFGRDPAVLGRTIRIGGTALTVAGVMQPGFSGLRVDQPADLWIPAVMQHEIAYRLDASNSNSDTDQPWMPQNGIAWLTLVARLDRAAVPAASGRLGAAHAAWLEDFLAGRDEAERSHLLRETLVLEPIPRGLSTLRGQFADPLRTLMGAVGLVLLIACANLASLLLARSVARTHEMAVRVSLGARPGRLVRQTLTESLALAVLGGIVGLGLAGFGARAMLRLASRGSTAIPLDISPDGRVLGFVAAITLLTGLLFGLAPALRSIRADLHDAFKTGGRVTGGSSGRLPLGRLLVVAQIALSLVLAAGAGLFVRTLSSLLATDPGFAREEVLSAGIDTRAAGYRPADLPGIYQRLLAEVEQIPGVRSASLSVFGFASRATRSSGLTVPGQVRDPSWDNSAREVFVTPAFFSTVGVPLLRGRDFSEADRLPGTRVAIVSESLARHFLDTVDVVGQRIGYGTPAEFEIVGVVRDAQASSLKEPPPRIIYYPMAQGPTEYATSLEARIAGPPDQIVPTIRAAIARVDRGLPVREVATLGDLLANGLRTERLVATLAGAFSVLALLLAGIGLYGVVAYSVSRRTNEMGVRLALGARPGAVRWIVLRDSWIMVGLGVAAGALLWLPSFSVVRNLAHGVPARDPVSLALAIGLLAIVGTMATLLPAWRASRVDPSEALRAE